MVATPDFEQIVPKRCYHSHNCEPIHQAGNTCMDQGNRDVGHHVEERLKEVWDRKKENGRRNRLPKRLGPPICGDQSARGV